MLVITIKQGKEKSLLQREQWIYASAVERVDGKAAERRKLGATVLVQSSSAQFLARAAYSPESQIRARVWSFDPNEVIDHAMIKRRVQAAVTKRSGDAKKMVGKLISLIVGDQDGLSGLNVEWIGGKQGYLVCEFHSAGVDAWKIPIVQALMAATGCPNVYERSDELMRKGEGLAYASGALAGDEPPDEILMTEKGMRFVVDLKTGYKGRA